MTPPTQRTVEKPAEKAATSALPTNPAAAEQAADNASESLRQMREAQRIERQQEEDARQIKQAVTGSLSQRLAQAAGKTEAASPATKPTAATTQALEQTAGSEFGRQVPVGRSISSGPRVRTAPNPAQAGRGSSGFSAPASSAGKLPVSASTVVAKASGLREHPKTGFYIRVAASLLGLVLLGSGIYFYRQQKTGGPGATAGNRNLLSSEDESAKLIKVAEQKRQQGETEAAAETLTKAIELTPSQPAPRQLLAETYETAGRSDEALKVYDGLLKVAPSNLSARLKIAELHRAKGNVNEARLQYQRIISLNQHSPEAARAYAALEELDSALAQLAASSTPFNSRPRRIAGQKRLGPVLPPTTDPRGQVSLIPQNPFTLPNNRSLLNVNPVRPLEAPDPMIAAAYHKSQGTTLYNRRQFSAAISEFQQALRLTPHDKDLYYFLGGSYYGLGQHAKAHEHYKKCDSGQYAATAQNGAARTEKAARKEYERQQKELLNSAQSEKAKQPSAPKDVPPGKSLQNSFQEQ